MKKSDVETFADDRHEWISILHDLKSLGPIGKALAIQFSYQSVLFDPHTVENDWDSIKNPKSHYRNIFKKAKEAGWRNPKSKRSTPETLGGLKFHPLAEVMMEKPQTEWLIKGFLEANSVATIIAPPSCYKSFLTVDMGFCIASGIDWHGHKVKKPRPVAFLIGEGERGFQKRVAAWAIEHDLDDIEKLPIVVSNQAGDLSDGYEQIIEKLESMDAPPELLVVDTLSRNAGRADENSTKDMANFVTNVDAIKNHFNCAVLLVHHTPLATESRGRGSSVVFGAVDFQFFIKKSEGSMNFTLKCGKAKDHELPENKHLIATSIELGDDEDGEVITSLVIHDGCDFTGSKSGLGRNQKMVLDKITRLSNDQIKRADEIDCAMGISVSEGYDEKWLPKQSVNTAITGLIGRGLINRHAGMITLDEF